MIFGYSSPNSFKNSFLIYCIFLTISATFLIYIFWNNKICNIFTEKSHKKLNILSTKISNKRTIPPFKKQYPDLDCARIINGNRAYIREQLTKKGRYRRRESQNSAGLLPLNCQSIYERHNFHLLNSIDQEFEKERKFPIAFVRTVYKDYQMLETEFALSYAPQNLYCFAIDAKSSKFFHRQIQALTRCFPNVFLVAKEKERKMDGGGINQLYSAVECLKLIAQTKYAWKYAIILQNHDVQLKTNQELVQILKWMNGTNDIQYTPVAARDWNFYGAGRNWTLANLHLFKNESLNQRCDASGQLLSLRNNKGNFQASLSHAFVNWMFAQLNLGPILEQLNKFGNNDEHLWGVLAANEFMGAPGGFTQKCFDQRVLAPGCTRLTIWESWRKLCQSRQWRHWLCIFGLEELAMLRDTPFLFANKMMPEMDAGAIECIHEMVYNRTHFDRGMHRLHKAYYAELPQVRYNRDKLSKEFDLDKFECCYKFLDIVKMFQDWTSQTCKLQPK